MSIITISRGAKSGGMALANALAERLGYPCLSREILVESARRYNIEEETLQSELSRPPSLWQRLTRERHRYVVFVKCSLLKAAMQGDLIYHGHAGQIFLEGIRHVLKVRIVAPLEQRIQAAMKELDIDHEQAAAHIARVDDERRRWVSFLYNQEWDDPALHDITINLAKMSLETACDLVASAAARPEFQPTEESRDKVADLSLESEVMAGIVADDKLWDQDLTVSAKSGVVAVHGRVKTRDQKQLIEEIVPSVKGVRDARLFLTLLSEPLPAGPPWRD